MKQEFSKVEVLPPLKRGEPMNKEKLIEEYDQLIKVYDHVHQKGRIPGDDLDVFNRRNATLVRMRELALQLKLEEDVLRIEEIMKNYLIPIPRLISRE